MIVFVLSSHPGGVTSCMALLGQGLCSLVEVKELGVGLRTLAFPPGSARSCVIMGKPCHLPIYHSSSRIGLGGGGECFKPRSPLSNVNKICAPYVTVSVLLGSSYLRKCEMKNHPFSAVWK